MLKYDLQDTNLGKFAAGGLPESDIFILSIYLAGPGSHGTKRTTLVHETRQILVAARLP